jgi:hypothetical protein
MRQRFVVTANGLVQAQSQPPVRDQDELLEGASIPTLRQESDLCPYKPNCDVVVNAVAYAPAGASVPRVRVRVLIESALPERDREPDAPETVRGGAEPGAQLNGNADGMTAPQRTLLDKTLVVTGERQIVERSLIGRSGAALLRIATLGTVRIPGWYVTSPQPFAALPMRYEYAYGGENRLEAKPGDRQEQIRRIGAQHCLTADQVKQHPEAALQDSVVPLAHSVCEQNPAGRGFATSWYLRHAGVRDMPAPRIEYPAEPFTAHAFALAGRGDAPVRPAGFGLLGRAWQARQTLLGAIAEKDHWDDSEFPALSAEFDHRYWNGAPADQQCAHLRGDEVITLVNLAPPGAAGTSTSAQADTVQRFALPGHAVYLALGDAEGRIGIKRCVLDTLYIDPESATVDLVWRATLSAEAAIANIELRVAEADEERAALDNLLALQAHASRDDLLPPAG